MKNILNSRLLLWILAGVFILYVITLFIGGTRIANDAAFGFLAMNTWQDGGDWNMTYALMGPEIVYSFQSWWAPGQYMVPWPFIKVLGLGYGIIVSQVVSMGLLCWGYRRLMRSFFLDDKIIYLSLIVFLIGRGYNSSIINYSADPYLATYSVYFILFYQWAKSRKTVLNIFLFFILSLAGLYIKNSFIIVLFSVLLYELLSVRKYSGPSLIPVLYTALPLASAAVLFYTIHLQRGLGIDKTGGIDFSLNNVLNALLKPVIAVFSAPFSFNAVLSKISEVFSLQASKMEDWGNKELLIMASVVVIAILWIFRPSLNRLKDVRNDAYKTLVVAFLGGYAIFYFYAILSNKDISTEDRLFLPLSVMVLPYLMQRANKQKMILIVFCVAGMYGIAAYMNDLQRNIGNDRTILASNAVIDGRVPTGLPLPYDATHGVAYIAMPEYCLLLPGKKCVLVMPAQVAGLLTDRRNTLVYISAGDIILRPGE